MQQEYDIRDSYGRTFRVTEYAVGARWQRFTLWHEGEVIAFGTTLANALVVGHANLVGDN